MRGLLLVVILVSAGLAGCIGSGGDDRREDRRDDRMAPPSQDGGGSHRSIGCGRTLEALLAASDRETASWEEIQCHAKGLERKPRPDFAKRMGMSVAVLSDGPMGARAKWGEIYRENGLNVSPAFASSLPPYAWPGARDIEYPLDDVSLDYRLRGVLPWFIAEKREGKAIHLQMQGPPGKAVPIWESAEAFRAWVDDVFVPQKIAEAKAAELIKAEYYDPTPVEIGVVWFASWPGVEGLGTRIPVAEQVELAQYALDRAREAVRPHFHGVLKVQLAARFDLGDASWTNLSFAGWDEVGLTFFPSCDLESTHRYLDAHVTAAQTIVQRDAIPWSVGEVDVLRHLFEACGTDFDAVEPDLYRAILGAIDDAEIQPVGANLYWETATPEARAVQKAWLDAR